MIPSLVLVTVFVVLRAAGFAAVTALDNWNAPLRIALAVMFLVTASAHWGRGRADLIRMVPPAFPAPATLITATGVLEILGALGLVIPATARVAALGLAVLMVAMFPANVRATRQRLTILGRPAPRLATQAALHALFIFAALGAGFLNR